LVFLAARSIGLVYYALAFFWFPDPPRRTLLVAAVRTVVMGRLMPQPVLLMIRELGLGGTERQLTAVARALDREKFEPHVGCFRDQGLRRKDLEEARVPIVRFPLESFKRPFPGVVAMIRYLRRHRIKLVHAFDAPAIIFGIPVAEMSGGVITVSSQRSHRELTPHWQHHVLRFTDRMADAVVVNCEDVARHLIEDERVPAGQIQLCYNGLDTEMFHPGQRARPAELAGASLTIGIVTALRPEKDLGTLLEAFTQVRGARAGMKLALVGDGASKPGLQAQTRALGIEQDCVFAGATRDVTAWLSAIDIFVLPSVSEALSNSLMEAMACGCCVVASRVGGNPELVKHEVSGLLFQARDTAGLAAALRLLIENEAMRRKLAQAGLRMIREKFSLPASARRMEAIYTTLLERK
jgi:glycosyltransferase involved in cell wall biosynthesis